MNTVVIVHLKFAEQKLIIHGVLLGGILSEIVNNLFEMCVIVHILKQEDQFTDDLHEIIWLNEVQLSDQAV